MVKLKSTCLEETIKTPGNLISFEFSSDLDCWAQNQKFIGSTLTDNSKLSAGWISNGSLCLEPYISSGVLTANEFQQPPEDPGIETFFHAENQTTQLKKYYEECEKYLLPPLEAVKKCLEKIDYAKEERHLNLQSYSVKSLEIYIIIQVMIGPPVIPLTHLNLSNCTFDDIGCIALSDFLQQSSVLKHLNLSGCPLGIRGAEILCDGFELSQSLVDLNLSKCRLTDIGGSLIMKALLFNEHCKRINLSYNHLLKRASAEFGNLLKQNHSLENINLEWNDFFVEPISAVPIFKALRQNENLKELNLAWNGISGKSFSVSLFRALRDHKYLKILNLENNRISESELPYILKAIKSTMSLEELYLGGNVLSGTNMFDLIKCLRGDVSLRLLHLGEYVWIPENSFLLANQIMSQKPATKIIFKGKVLPNPPDPVHFKELIIDRAKYLAMAPKKKKLKRDLGHFMINVMNSEQPYYRRESFEDLLKKFKAKLDENLVRHLQTEFTQKIIIGNKSAKLVLLKDMAKFYLERHSTDRRPPPPPKKKRRRKGRKEMNGENKRAEKEKVNAKGKSTVIGKEDQKGISTDDKGKQGKVKGKKGKKSKKN